MILPGRSLIPRIIGNVRNTEIQAQPCGVDLTLKGIKIWTSPGCIDYDNELRHSAKTKEVPFVDHAIFVRKHSMQYDRTILENKAMYNKHVAGDFESAMLNSGAYQVEFNETVDVPLDLMGQILVRSSLFRSGALISAGVIDSGYKGVIGAMLQVVNPHGLLLFRDARLAQLVFHQMSESVKGYSGVYQGSHSI